MAYINFIKASWPIICLHSYLYFSLITVQIQWLLCLNHIHKFFLNKKQYFHTSLSCFRTETSVCVYVPFCILTKWHYWLHSSSRPLQKLHLIWDSKVLLPVSVFPLKHNVCVLFCVLIIKESVGCWADMLFQTREDTRRTKTCKECPADQGLSTSLPL